jgi:hypothetical protein
MLALTALFAGIAFLVPFWLNTPNRLTGRADD